VLTWSRWMSFYTHSDCQTRKDGIEHAMLTSTIPCILQFPHEGYGPLLATAYHGRQAR